MNKHRTKNLHLTLSFLSLLAVVFWAVALFTFSIPWYISVFLCLLSFISYVGNGIRSL